MARTDQAIVMKSGTRTKARSRRKFRASPRGTAANTEAQRRIARQALLVLGMHRSGTSALTRVFSLLGANLPKNILGANPTNEAGHWESADLMTIHDELLASAGSQWDDWRAFNPDWIQSGVAEGYRQKLLGALHNDFNGSPLFVLKDPRICRFVPFWLEVLERFSAEAHIVISVRNPLEVAASLKRRDNFPPAKTYLLWLRHVLDAERATRHLPRAVVTFNDLLTDWRGVVGAVAAKTGSHWPRRSDSSELEIDQFLADPLRHHVADDAQLTVRADVVDWVKEAYRLLQHMAQNRKSRDQFERLDRIHFEFDKACLTFGLVLAAEAEQNASQLRSVEVQIKTRNEDLVRLSGELAQAKGAANEAQISAAASQSQAAALADELEAARAELSRERDQIVAALEEERVAAARNRAHVVEIAQELETLQNAAREHEAAATKLKAELDGVQSLANSRGSEVDKLSRELASGQSALRDRDREIQRLTHDVDASRRSLRDGQTEVQRLAGELDGARAESERADAERQRTLELLKAGSEALSLAAAELPAVREEIALLDAVLGELRQEADRREQRISESSREFQVAADQAAHQENEVTAAYAARVRELKARLDEESAQNANLTAEIRRLEKSAADHVIALEASRTVTLAESESKAQTQIRVMRNRLIDAEAALAKATRERNSVAWMGPFSESRRAVRQLEKSGLIDADWYLREYPDVAASGRAPAEHYVTEGYACGYRPNPFFDTRWYLERYEDVRRSGKNPLLHYIQYGAHEGRDPGPNFQTRYYLEINPDVRGNGINPLAHYLRYGRHEGRLPAPRA